MWPPFRCQRLEKQQHTQQPTNMNASNFLSIFVRNSRQKITEFITFALCVCVCARFVFFCSLLPFRSQAHFQVILECDSILIAKPNRTADESKRNSQRSHWLWYISLSIIHYAPNWCQNYVNFLFCFVFNGVLRCAVIVAAGSHIFCTHSMLPNNFITIMLLWQTLNLLHCMHNKCIERIWLRMASSCKCIGTVLSSIWLKNFYGSNFIWLSLFRNTSKPHKCVPKKIFSIDRNLRRFQAIICGSITKKKTNYLYV